MQTTRLRIGTRGSRLALAQAHEARGRLCAAHGLAEDEVEIVVIATTGDRVRDRPLWEIGGKGLFTKEIEEALIAGSIDLAVHSMKDMPSRLPGGLAIAALLPREDARDAFLSPVAACIADLPRAARVGSSSVRRSAQLRRLRPDVAIAPFRGNVDTRLRKLAAGETDATFLACAGLKRLGLAERITAAMSLDDMLPAVAQGAIGIEIREGDGPLRELLAPLDHRDTAIAVSCERAFLAVLDGSCKTPIAGHAILEGEILSLRGQALTVDGLHSFTAIRDGPASDAVDMGREVAEEIKTAGGALIAL